VSAGLMDGDFLDGVVESAMRSMAIHLKAEYRKELCKAFEVASLEAVTCDNLYRGEAPVIVLSPSLNMPVIEPSEDTLRLAGGLQTLNVSEHAVMDNTRGCITCPPPPCASRLSPKNSKSGVWSESMTNNPSKNTASSTGRSQHSPARCLDGPTRTNSRTGKRQVRLTQQERESLKRIRNEEIAQEEAVLTRRGSRASALKAPALDEASQCRLISYKLVASPEFDFCMGVVIIANALTIGLETSFSRHGREIPASLNILECSFVIIYCVELVMRVYGGGGPRAFSNNWVRFDAVMVAAGIFNLLFTMASFGGGAAADVVDSVSMLKMLRLCRLAKTVRVLVQFRTLWMLVQGLMYAVLPMLWTAILMSVVIYVFAVVAMETIIASDQDDDYSTAARNYDTIGGSMLSLMQVLTLDSAAAIYRPLIATRPWLIMYFLVFILLGPIALMNIVTAIMVESSLRTANEDKEARKAWKSMKRKSMMPQLRSIFFALDTSGDGEVDLKELLNAPPEIKEALQHIVGLDELEEVFSLMDYDGSGVIDIGEFVDGIMRSQADKPSELFVLVKQSKAILEMLQGLGPRPPARTSACEGAPCNAWDCESLAT